MNIYYDIDRCEAILNRLNELVDRIDRYDEQLYRELETLDSFWKSDASSLFLQNVCETEALYVLQLSLFKSGLEAMNALHKKYREAKESVEKKFRELQNG